MNDLNDIEKIKRIDPKNTYDSTKSLADQCLSVFNETYLKEYKKLDDVKNIIFCGMGASMYSGVVIKSLFQNILKIPIEVVSDYSLPSYADENSLIILTSYSGTTEEVLSCASEALKVTQNIIVITKGGQLSEIAEKNNLNSYIFDPVLNPAGVPRLGNGYTILSIVAILIKLGLLNLNAEEIQKSLETFKSLNSQIETEAKNLSLQLADSIPVVIASEHLLGNCHILRNQFNETSKSFSSYFMVPDLNHHLMEGLAFPKNQNLFFLIFNSTQYKEKNQKRITLTQEVIEKNDHKTYLITLSNHNVFEDFINMLLFGSYLSFYLGILNDQNPAINPWVDYFKEKLK